MWKVQREVQLADLVSDQLEGSEMGQPEGGKGKNLIDSFLIEVKDLGEGMVKSYKLNVRGKKINLLTLNPAVKEK